MIAGSLFSPAQLVGYVALVLGVSAFLQKSDTRLKVLMACEGLAYVVHFILLGNLPASGSALASSVRMLVSIKSRSPGWIAVFVAVNVAIGVAFATGPAGWLPVAASCLATVAVFVMRGIPMRLILLVCTLLWLVNNVLSGSVGGMVLEALIAVANLATIVTLVVRRGREQRVQRTRVSRCAAAAVAVSVCSSHCFGQAAPAAVAPEAYAVAEALLGRKATADESKSPEALWEAVERGDELLADWLRQDLALAHGPELFVGVEGAARFLQVASPHVVPASAGSPPSALRSLSSSLAAYRNACLARRERRLARVRAEMPQLVYARHFVMGGSHYAYTEALSDAQAERNFRAGGKLCLAEWREGLWQETVLTETKEGVIRDADVDYDGKKILFALKKSDRGDDYHLYEMDAVARTVRQLTDGLGIADYEGCYLPGGDLVFNSTRCMQIVDCWWTEVSNLYRCDRDGKNILRLTFDQVHDNYPTVTLDGNVLYTRWEYNDRSQMYPQPLFQMSPDGTQQRAVYGENSWFPTTIIHARGIPDSGKIFAIATGHHSRQPGDLILIDPAKGRQEAEGVTLVAPVRPTKPVIVDAYGQDGDLFAYPYPIDERSLIAMYSPDGWGQRNGKRHEERSTGFGLYWMDIDGQRELLVSRHGLSCGRPVPLRPRPRPAARPSAVDLSEKAGTFYVQNVYVGEAMDGVPPGAVKTLRVIGLDYRLAGIGSNSNGGPGGGALVSTPPSIGNGAWDPKILIGDAPVYEDGSAFFTAEARSPLYFMLLDEKGRLVQTMRSWTVLQPGENASCVGCHESKNSVPLATARPTQALASGARPLKPIGGPRRGFSFLKEVQPVLDAHCVTCHDGKDEKKPDLTAAVVTDPAAKRHWTRSYLALTHARPDDKERQARWRGDPTHKVVNWVSAASAPPLQKPLSAGSNRCGLFTELLDKGHCKTLTPDAAERLALWIDLGVPFCGDYTEANAWDEKEQAKYEQYKAKRDRADAEERAALAAWAGSLTWR